MEENEVRWKDRKRNFLGLPWSFTRYSFTDKVFTLNKGLFNIKEDDVRLYRIVSITMTRNFWQRIIGCGTIHLDTTDKALGNFDVKNIKNPSEMKNTLSELIETSRKNNRVYAREDMVSHPDGENHDHFHEDMPEDMEHPEAVDQEMM